MWSPRNRAKTRADMKNGSRPQADDLEELIRPNEGQRWVRF
jgi:hypothetical protein